MRYDITHIKGAINGRAFTGEGKGSFDPTTAISEGRMVFQNFPGNYLPLLCRSWRCKHHPSVPPKERPQLRLFPRRNYDLDETVIYTGGAAGEIHTTGKVREIAPDTTEAFSEFNGWYNGPLDVAAIPVHRETFTPIEQGGYHITGYRRVEMKDGTSVEVQWYGRLTLLLQEGDQWEPITFTQEYRLISWNWQSGATQSVFDKTLEVSKVLGGLVRFRPVTADELPTAYEIYRKAEAERLSRLGLSAERVPMFTPDTFRAFLENRDILVLGAWHNDRLAGVGVVALETEPDDLLPPPYGDIICLAVAQDHFGLGVESGLFSNLSTWVKERGCRVLRTTILEGVPAERLLWQSLGVKPVAVRGQFLLP